MIARWGGTGRHRNVPDGRLLKFIARTAAAPARPFLLLLPIRSIWNNELADGRNLKMGSSEIESALKKLGKRHALTEPEFKELMWGVYEKVPFRFSLLFPNA